MDNWKSVTKVAGTSIKHDVPQDDESESQPRKHQHRSGGYDVVEDAGFESGPYVIVLIAVICRVEFAVLARLFDKIGATTKRLEITALLRNFIRSLIAISPDDLLPAIYLCTNRVWVHGGGGDEIDSTRVQGTRIRYWRSCDYEGDG